MPGGRRREERTLWGASGLRLPLLHPLQAHALAKRGAVGGPRTAAVQVGFNRAQRRALWAKKGPSTMTRWGRETSTPAQSFLPGKGAWNKFALRMEFSRRLGALQDAARRRNRWHRRLGRALAAWWWFAKFTARLVYWRARGLLGRLPGPRGSAR